MGSRYQKPEMSEILAAFDKFPKPEYMEAFEVSEYGRAPTEDDMKLLFG